MKKQKLSHIDTSGKATMVDVSEKANQHRKAVAKGEILLSSETVQLIRENKIKKGDVLTIAEFAGITAAKKTSDLIPLCHPVFLAQVTVQALLIDTGVDIEATAISVGQTGVEMEALTAVQIALLTIYDMCKAVDKKMNITNVRLIHKSKTNI